MSICAVAVAVEGFDVVHTTVADARFYIVFASLLFDPIGACAAARHESGNTVIVIH